MYETLTRNSAAICHTGQRGGPLALWRIAKRLIGCLQRR